MFSFVCLAVVCPGTFAASTAVPLDGSSSPSRARLVTTGGGPMGTAPVVSFVQMSFQDRVVRTSAHAGSAPQWNELLTLPFKAPGGDYSPNVLNGVSDAVVVSVFDEVTSSFIRDDRDKHTAFTQTEYRLLGSLTVPFSTLYHLGHFEGEFRLESPLSNLAYVSKKDLTVATATVATVAHSGVHDVDAATTAVSNMDLVDSSRDAHIFVSLTLTPQLQQPESDAMAKANADVRPRAPGIDTKVMDHAKAWENKYHRKDRPVKVCLWDCLGVNDLMGAMWRLPG